MSFLLAVVGGFASGVFLRSLVFQDWYATMFVLFTSVVCVSAWLLKARRAYLLLALGFAFIALGMLRASIAESPPPETFLTELRQRVSYDAVVVADPDLRDASERIVVEVSAHGARVKMLAVVRRTTDVGVGDRVRVSGTLILPQSFASENGRLFRYDKYLEKEGVRFLLQFARMHVVERAPWYSVPAALAKLKHLFLDGLSRALPEPYASLAGGITIGGKSGLGAELQDAFIRSGLVQIVVLSGYNVMVVAEWVMAALAYANLSRRTRALAGALALLVFVGIAGASATAVRASVMALIALYARATGKTYAAGRALFFAVFLMLIWNPLYLAFDPGFALSVAATAGLIWLAPIVEARFSRIQNALLRNAIATTLAAQIAVLPLLLYFTGNLSPVSLPANVIAMPLTPIAMGLSALAGVAGMLFTSVPALLIALGFPAYLATAALIELATESAALPGAALSIPAFPFWVVLVPYAALTVFAWSKRRSMTDQFTLSRKALT